MKIDKIETIESVVLCKLSKSIIGELPVSCVTSIENTIDEVPKLELKVKKYMITQDGKKKVVNPLYDEIKNKRYLLINEEKFYIIDQVKESKISGVKEVMAYGGEQTLTKFPVELEDIYLQLLTDDIENGIYSLNTLLKEIGWQLGYVENTVAYDDIENKIEKVRLQENVKDNMLDFLKELSEQFEFYSVFDETNRTIDLYDINTMSEEIKICLTKDNYLKSKEIEKDSDDLITVLKLEGNEELDVARYIPGGYSSVTNFSYFIETNEMSDELIEALAKYDEMIESRHEYWLQLVDEKIAKETELLLKKNQWLISITNIEGYKRMIENYILKEMVVEENTTRVKLAEEKDNELILRLEIDDLLNEIDLIQESIDNINSLCRYETCTDENGELVFNQNLLDELLEFIFIDTYNDDSFVDADALIEKGKSILEEKCKPTTQIEIDSINFISRIIDNSYRLHWTGELSFGDIIMLIDEDTGSEVPYYFIGYSINYESNSLNLTISNKKSKRDNAKKINEYLKEMKKTKALLMSNKYLFNDIKNNELNMKGRGIK